ncbi:MAG: tetratricopeptide repeat protein [Alphaproteobacteria bacterium]|nr:tetratricopeptide repeat protein [Alphaproteobacteria bacterium]
MRTISTLFVLCAMASTPAFAGTLPLSILERCADPARRSTLEDQVRACTLVIETPGQDRAEKLLALLGRATAYRDNGDYDKAIADYNALIALDPDEDMAFLGRADAYRLKGDEERALAELNAFIQRKPTNASAYYNRGRLFAARGDLPRALADCTRAIELEPGDASAWFQRALVYRQMGDDERTLADLGRAIQLDPDDPDHRHYRGMLLMRRKDYKGAIADFDNIIRVKPRFDAYVFRGYAYFYLGNYDAAIADAERAINFNPNDPLPRQLLREAQAAKARTQSR